MRTWQLNPQVRARRTASGGAVLLPWAVITVELDMEAWAALSLLTAPHTARTLRPRLIAQFGRNFTLAEIDLLLCDLAARGVLIEGGNAPANQQATIRDLSSLIPAPESVHLQLNNVCNLRCPSCYVGLHEEDVNGLPLERIRSLIDEWAEMGVFQLALGGGEPLMSPKFASVVRYARERGIVPNATTNGWLISEALLDEVTGHLGELRMSLNDAVTINLALLEEKAALLRSRGVRFGVNLIVTRQNLNRLAESLRWACDQGAATVNLIRPKPAPGNEHWYERNALSSNESSRLAAMLPTFASLFSATNLTVDCAFSFLFHDWPAEKLRAHAVAGCAMGERFATVKWNGDVLPCSHLHGEEFNAGNVARQSFSEIWRSSAVFEGVRREIGAVKGRCGECGHNAFCKGCRAIAQLKTGDWIAADAGCTLA